MGIWFQGRDDAATSDQTLASGYAVRFRSDNGNIQALNFLGGTSGSLAGWSNPSATANTADFDASTDTFRLTVSSGTLSDEIDILLENVTDSITLASYTATRTNRNSNPDAGSVFGFINNSGVAGASFDNISVTSEPSSAETGSNQADIFAMDSQAQMELFRRSRESLSNDPYRPLYHFSPPVHRLHDPAGLVYWKGKYHLFYLYITPEVTWGRGHAVSEDLVHWEDLPTLPREIRGGTGQGFVDDDRVILSYARAKLAWASDELLTEWTEHPGNPVLVPGNDSDIWKEEGTYYMTLRSPSMTGGVGPDLRWLGGKTTGVIARSEDLMEWEHLGNLFVDSYFTELGEDFGCINFLPIDQDRRLALFFSHKRGPQYYIGKYDRAAHRFHPEVHGRMNYGPVKRGSLHAPTAFTDPNGRHIAMWNIIENRPQDGWNQILSLPRRLSVDWDTLTVENYLNPLTIEPIEELKSLRFDPVTTGELIIPANGEKVLSGVEGKAMELELEIDPMGAREVGINVFRSPDGTEQTTISVLMQGWSRDPNMRELMIDVSRASLDPRVNSRSPELGPLYLEKGETIKLRVFIDRSVVEVFANGRQCLTLRTYPSLEESRGVSVFARGSEAKLIDMTAWQMRSIWPELTSKEGQ